MFLVLLFFLRFFRQFFYEIFLKMHQNFANLILYAIWRHTKIAHSFISLCITIDLSILTMIILLQLATIFYRNLIFNQVNEMTSLTKLQSIKEKNVLFIDITITRFWKMRVEQYINFWISTFNLRSFFQSHLTYDRILNRRNLYLFVYFCKVSKWIDA